MRFRPVYLSTRDASYIVHRGTLSIPSESYTRRGSSIKSAECGLSVYTHVNVSVARGRRHTSSTYGTRMVQSCCHTELTMRLIKPAVARLLALFPVREKFCPGPSFHCEGTSSRLRARAYPRPRSQLFNNTLLFVAHLTDNRNISVTPFPLLPLLPSSFRFRTVWLLRVMCFSPHPTMSVEMVLFCP